MACSLVEDTFAPLAGTGQMRAFDTTAAGSGDLLMTELPGPFSGPLVWTGVDYKNEEMYTCQLSQNDNEEIDAALKSFKTLGLDGDEVGQHNFPLPNLAPRLADCAKAVHEGKGFFVVRGIDGSRYSIEDNTTIYLGIASYVADKRGLQDRKGNMLTHITDSKSWKVPMEQRHKIHSSQALPYHNDMGCEILALQVRQGSKDGGDTYLSSVWAAFNELLSKEPSVAETLLAPNWPVQVSSREAKHYLAPALVVHEGRLMASMDPHRFGRHRSGGSANIPSLTASQTYALDKISNAAYQTELRLKLQTDDLLFFNNWALLHRRDSYTDDDETSRHMVRLWLRNTQLGWSVPVSLSPPWLAAYGDNNQVQNRLYPLVPMPVYKVPKYSAGSAAFMLEDSDASDDE